jgi:GTP cyclohydrolase IA
LMAFDEEGARRAIRDLLVALGHDPDADPDLAETPARVVEAFQRDLLSGEGTDLGALIRSGSAAATGELAADIVVVRDIAIATMCPHHLLPASGAASVAYIPGERLLGLGTLASLLDACCRRLTLQESIGPRVVAALMDHAGARGAHCRITLAHSCLSLRGARQAGATVTTLAGAGELALPGAAALLAGALGEPRV